MLKKRKKLCTHIVYGGVDHRLGLQVLADDVSVVARLQIKITRHGSIPGEDDPLTSFQLLLEPIEVLVVSPEPTKRLTPLFHTPYDSELFAEFNVEWFKLSKSEKVNYRDGMLGFSFFQVE